MNYFIPLASPEVRNAIFPSVPDNGLRVRAAGDPETDAALAQQNADMDRAIHGAAVATTATLVTLAAVEVLSVGVSAYHGYKREHNSTGAAVAWGLVGLFFPVVTPIVAVAQGYAVPAKK